MGGNNLFSIFVICAIFLIPIIVAIIVNQWKIKKLQREPLEELAIVFAVRSADSRSGLRAREVNLSDDIYLVKGGGIIAGEEGGGDGKSRARITYLGKATQIEPNIIEIQGKGWMYKRAMVPERGSANDSVGAGNAWYRLTKSQGGSLVPTAFEAKVLEVRPVSLATQIQPQYFN